MNAVVGLGWGDEGKGLVTDYLCGEAVASGKHPVVIRTNGGHQAGHTVVRNGRRHVFSSFGSGTLLGGSTYWTAACTFNPTAFMNERKLLEDIDPFFAIHPHSPVTTPYDIKANRDMETRLGHGSVGVGFGTTLQREEDHRHLFVQDLYHPRVLKEKLNMIAGYYGYKPDEEAVRRFLKDAEACCDHMVLVDDWTRVCSLRNPEYIFEGAQGIMLDQKFGIFPNVTRSYTTSHQARAMGASDIYYVTRSYATRHGNGWFPGEMPLPLTNNSEETNKKHDWQGEFRTALLDPDLLTYALDCDRAKCRKHLVITCMDQFPIDIPNLLEAVRFEFITILASYGPQANNIKRIR